MLPPPEGRSAMTRPAKCNAHFSAQSRCSTAVRQACISRFIASGHSARAATCTAASAPMAFSYRSDSAPRLATCCAYLTAASPGARFGSTRCLNGCRPPPLPPRRRLTLGFFAFGDGLAITEN